MKDTNTNTKPICDICGLAVKKLQHVDGQMACSSCNLILETVQNNPTLIKNLWRTYQDEPILLKPHPHIIDSEGELPEVLDGKRYRTVDREFNKWYLSVSEIKGKPVEIFASTAFERDHRLQSRISNLTTITRLISLILRHVVLGERITLDKCLVQIKRSSRQQDDLPDMLHGVLNKYNTPDKEQ